MGGTVIYALGGGLGHFTRSLAVAHTFGDELPSPCTVLTSPGVAQRVRPFLTKNFSVRELSDDAVTDAIQTQRWIAGQLEELAPATLVIDCFPLGIFGELGDLLATFPGRRIHIARALKAIPHSGQNRTALYDIIHEVEPCPTLQRERLAASAPQLEPLQLRYPSIEIADRPKNLQRTCLIVHTGDADETRALRELADRTYPLLEKLTVSAYPAWQWFAEAGAVVSACGFNTMEQMRGLRTPHTFLPMLRRFDDQAGRAERCASDRPTGASLRSRRYS